MRLDAGRMDHLSKIAMTDEDMIDQLVELYPKWQDESHVASMRVSGIKRLIRQAYAEGREAGMKRANTERALRDIGRRGGAPDLFSQLFGNKGK